MPRKIPTFRMRPKPPQPDGRPSAHRRGYNRTWHRLRILIITSEPLCRSCRERGLTVPATEVDHVVPLAQGGTNEPSNLQPLCRPCHSAKTATRDGGLGHAKEPACASS